MGCGKIKMAIRIAEEGEGCNRNALPLRSERSSTKLENTSLSTGVPLGFLYAAFPFLSYKLRNVTVPVIYTSINSVS
jgi:hypothetical protein